MSLSLESIKAEIDNLANQLYHNSKAVAETGRRMLSIEKTTGKPTPSRGVDPTSRIRNSADSDDEADDDDDGTARAVASEDLVQLVTELQTQLDILDARSIRRTANAFATKDDDLVAALPANDGFIPGESVISASAAAGTADEDETSLPKSAFPRTVGAFKGLSRADVEAWLRYYELLPPDEAELQSLLSQAKPGAGAAGKEGHDLLSEEEADRHFDTLARFLGLRIRRTKAVW